MPLTTRLALPTDHAAIESMVLASFEPITWQKKLDAQIGPLNGQDWRARWHTRLRHIFATQIILIGEADGALAAMASASLDSESALAFIDVLAVSLAHQGRGYGREILDGVVAHLQSLGCQYVNLDCLTDNDAGNALYQSAGFTEVARHIRWFRKL